MFQWRFDDSTPTGNAQMGCALDCGTLEL